MSYRGAGEFTYQIPELDVEFVLDRLPKCTPPPSSRTSSRPTGRRVSAVLQIGLGVECGKRRGQVEAVLDAAAGEFGGRGELRLALCNLAGEVFEAGLQALAGVVPRRVQIWIVVGPVAELRAGRSPRYAVYTAAASWYRAFASKWSSVAATNSGYCSPKSPKVLGFVEATSTSASATRNETKSSGEVSQPRFGDHARRSRLARPDDAAVAGHADSEVTPSVRGQGVRARPREPRTVVGIWSRRRSAAGVLGDCRVRVSKSRSQLVRASRGRRPHVLPADRRSVNGR